MYNRIARFFLFYRRRILHLFFEELFGWLVRSLPGFAGMVLRWGLYRLLLNRLASFPLIYPGVYFTHSYGLRIGKSFAINTGAFIDSRGGVTIGDHVLVGPYVVIVSSNHDTQATGEPITARNHIMAPVYIGDNVWIGAHAVITAGIRIGNNSVIGAGSVVTRDIPDNCVAAGVPARVIERRLSAR